MDTLAQDIMATELITIHEGTTVEECLKTLINSRITGLPVVNAKNEMVGVVSEFDVLVQLSKHKRLKPAVFQEPIEFTRDSETVEAHTPLSDVVHLFVGKKFRRLPVVDKKKRLIGIITRRDLMRVFYYRARLT